MASSYCFVDAQGGSVDLHHSIPLGRPHSPCDHQQKVGKSSDTVNVYDVSEEKEKEESKKEAEAGVLLSGRLGVVGSLARIKDHFSGCAMASWTMPPRGDERDHAFFWQDMDGVPVDDTNDFFGQFVDFDGHATTQPGSSLATTSADGLVMDQAVPRLPETLLLDHPSESLGSSTADEFDFLSTSSHIGGTSSVSQDIDPSSLTTNGHPHSVDIDFDHHDPLGGHGSISDTDLPRVEGICLSSPIKAGHTTISQPTSPTPPNTVTQQQPQQRKTTNKFVEAVQSTIRKATTRRKPKKPPVIEDRPVSPAGDVPLKAPRQRPRVGLGVNTKTAQESFSGSQNFVHGACDDPFNEVPPLPAPGTLRYFHQDGVSPPLVSPAIQSEPGSYHTENTAQIAWDQQQPATMPMANGQWNGSGVMTPSDGGWWDYNMMTQNGQFVDQKHAADFNIATHSQQAQLPYEYQHQLPDTATSGLMIQMPQPRQVQPTVVHDLTMNAHTHLPPPPPVPAPPAAEPEPMQAPPADHDDEPEIDISFDDVTVVPDAPAPEPAPAPAPKPEPAKPSSKPSKKSKKKKS